MRRKMMKLRKKRIRRRRKKTGVMPEEGHTVIEEEVISVVVTGEDRVVAVITGMINKIVTTGRIETGEGRRRWAIHPAWRALIKTRLLLQRPAAKRKMFLHLIKLRKRRNLRVCGKRRGGGGVCGIRSGNVSTSKTLSSSSAMSTSASRASGLDSA